VGDGRLNYGPEEILEAYYDVKVCKWLSLTPAFSMRSIRGTIGTGAASRYMPSADIWNSRVRQPAE